MSPKSKKNNGWSTDHKAAWITGGLGLVAALVAGAFGLFKFSGATSPVNSITGSNNHLVAVTANQTGNTTIATGSTVAPQTVSVGENTGQFYAPQSTVVNNYYSPISNSVTRDAFEALENRLTTATNKIELTVGEVQKLAQALRDLDHRTAAMEVLPDGRTRFGGTVAGMPNVIFELMDTGFQSYQATDYKSALDSYLKAISLFEGEPKNLLVEDGHFNDNGKNTCYFMVAICAQQLKSNNIANEYAEKAVNVNPSILNQSLLVTTLANLGADEYKANNFSLALDYLTKAIKTYELAQNTPGVAGYFNSTKPDGTVASQTFLESDQLKTIDVARIYGMSAIAAHDLGSNSVALEYANKSYQLNPRSPLPIWYFQNVRTNR